MNVMPSPLYLQIQYYTSEPSRYIFSSPSHVHWSSGKETGGTDPPKAAQSRGPSWPIHSPCVPTTP